jgi:hypothetical protein
MVRTEVYLADSQTPHDLYGLSSQKSTEMHTVSKFSNKIAEVCADVEDKQRASLEMIN